MIARNDRVHVRAAGARRAAALPAAPTGSRARRGLPPAPHFDARGAR